MDMQDKVIKWLETCIKGCDDTCPYKRECESKGGFIEPMTDALTLLKAQEPRVIRWQDAESMRLCWVETRFPHTISPADIMHYFAESPNITVFKIHQAPMDWPIDEYCIKWRCWDKEPTNEQMEAVKWDG